MAYDHWCTPPWLTKILGDFDLDVASNDHSFVRANMAFSKNPYDGLVLPWRGRIYCNPPYSDPGPWATRFCEHNGPAVWLSESASGVSWFQRVLLHGDEIYFFNKRLAFYDPRQGKEVRGARNGHVLVMRNGGLNDEQRAALSMHAIKLIRYR